MRMRGGDWRYDSGAAGRAEWEHSCVKEREDGRCFSREGRDDIGTRFVWVLLELLHCSERVG